MRLTPRLTPYLLLGVLTLGTGLGIGVGLSEAPVGHQLARPTVAVPTVTSHWITCSGAATNVSCDELARHGATGPRVFTVPNIVGLGVQLAMGEVVSDGLDVVAEPAGPTEITVIAEEPAAGTKVARGSTVIVLLGPSCFPSNAPDSLRMVTTNGRGTDGSGYSSGGS